MPNIWMEFHWIKPSENCCPTIYK